MSSSDRVATLRSLIRILTAASEIVIKEWEAEDMREINGLAKTNLPSHELFDAQRAFIGSCNMCIDIVDEPLNRLLDISYSVSASRALFLAVLTNIPDILDGGDNLEGVAISQLSRATGVREDELARILRLLSTKAIFTEVRQDHFANSHIGRILVKNKPLQSIVLLLYVAVFSQALQLELSMHHLPATLLDSSSTRSAFQRAAGTELSYFDYFGEEREQADAFAVSKYPYLDIFSSAMVGFNQGCSPPLIADFPWASLSPATVVDVGGGVGSMSLDLAKAFPSLRFVVQDLPVVIEQARAVWETEYAEAVSTGRVQLMAHDFLMEQPVKAADVYMLRYVLHDWPDDKCVAIFSRLREAMGPKSRILVAEMVIHPTSGSTWLKNAPRPLPANHGQPHERTPEQFAGIAKRAGLEVKKIWECRGPISIVEMCTG
ncbi:S-adenosyl-L-methionine-dependent methyltransferase [Fomitopsis serialis]|uniref:S-adenosyl-L-methionine-dependent methyltransferase n=1 Tax=Fomitopsis serialis TaxID=139415 RepID=UPI002008BD54|nr:S-adenosyl-L-methionine-dependent methyltransferase [Neoantrodia serialis]KAH9924169.1 S-adenosyl-L-methionine-dependent methyltransferase [Neoantrodia serialis]